MTPFGDGQGTEIPYPPQEVPTPTLPGANFADIGAQAAAGQASARPAGWWLRPFIDALAEIIARVATALLNCWLSIVSYILRLILQQFQKSDANMDALAVSALSGMLGVMDGKPGGAVGGGETQSHAVAGNLAGILTQGLKKGVADGGQATIAPGTTGADNFMKMSAHMAIEGWLQGCAVEMASANFMERFADLKDTLERAFGMGRLARRVMGPPVKVFAEDPYTQALNQTYTPTLLSPGELVKEYLRDPTQETKYYQQMLLHGYNTDRATSVLNSGLKFLSPEQVYHLKLAGLYNQDQASSHLAFAGYLKQEGLDLLTELDLVRVQGLNRKLVEEALSLYKEGKLTRAKYDTMVGSSGLPQPEPDIYGKLADLIDAAKVTPKTPEPIRMSLAEGLKLLERGTWQLNDYEQLLNYYNYIPSDEVALATLALDEATDWQLLQKQKADALAARQQKEADRLRKAQMMVEDIGVNTAMFETLIEDGQRTLGQYTQYLLNKSVAADNAIALTNAMRDKIVQKAAAAAAKLAAQNKAKTKNVDLAQLETAVKQGLMDIPTFTARVKALGMDDADAALIAQELSNSISSAATKAKAVAAAKATAAQKHVDLSQEERAVRLGIVSMNDYQAFLVAHGFDAEEQGVLMMELQDQLNADKATAAKKAAAATKATTKGITIAQLEKQIRAGIGNIGDYTAALATAGYDAADQASMTQYLQLQMDQDQQDLILHGHASALVDQLGVSLADLERAVKLSVVPIATYQDALQRAGVSGPDQQTLVANLAAQIKATRAQQSTTASVSKQVAAAGLSLATLEKDTVSGKISIDQFTALLNGYNVAAADVADVVALVNDEIANQKAVAALVADATAKAKAKGLDLAQLTAAYKQQVITEDDWRARVSALGYDASSVEILFETLAATQAAAAAKSATKATGTAAAAAAAGSSPAAGG